MDNRIHFLAFKFFRKNVPELLPFFGLQSRDIFFAFDFCFWGLGDTPTSAQLSSWV
jgi:hypothetical protein